jgi:hypothetical protein
MDRMPNEISCEMILHMWQESPEAADAVIEMIMELDEVDEACARMIRERQQAKGAMVT